MNDGPALRPATPRMSHSVFAAIDFAKGPVKQTGALLAEEGWVVSSTKLEPPLGGGAGESCGKSCRPKDG
jgi:hypothetical protein